MKYSSIKAVCLVVLACVVALSSYAQDDRNAGLTSVVLESFNGDTTHEWIEGRYNRSYEFSWGLAASKFATKADDNGNDADYPVSAYVGAWPYTLYGYNREGKDIKSFGIHGRFDRRGYNWIDIYPVNSDGEPFEIPMPGKVRYFDLWVWGSNHDMNMEAYVRDYQGMIHLIRLGSLNYTGWNTLRANIPGNIQQGRRTLPRVAQMKFVKFRIWTLPADNVSDFYIYLNQFKVLTNTLEAQFDGDELSDPDYVPQLWADGSGTN
jgi:hypothetical protein